MARLSRRVLLGGAAAGSVSVIAAPAAATATPSSGRWVTSWATAQTAPTATDADAGAGFTDTTIRQVLRLSAGGPIRLRFATPFGDAAITVGPVTAGDRPVLFSGEKQVLLAAGATVLSDPVDLHVPDRGWPDQFAALYHRSPAVANLGISGNRLLLDDGRFGPGGQARFDRDVLALPGLGTVLVFLGINDIQQPPGQLDPAVLLTAYGQLARRARDHELKVLGATIGPFKGWMRYTHALDHVRRQVNAGLRTGRIFDDLVDVDAALCDPADPARLRPDFNSGDGLHPNSAGAQAIALLAGKEFNA